MDTKRITILVLGSAGDIYPFLGLAYQLEQRGFILRIATSVNYKNIVCRSGFEFEMLSLNHQEILESDFAAAYLNAGNQIGFYRWYGSKLIESATDLAKDIINACQDTHVLVTNLLLDDWALAISEKFDIPLFICHAMPIQPTNKLPNILLTGTYRNQIFPVISHWLYRVFEWIIRKKPVNILRDILHLEPGDSIRIVAEKDDIPIFQMWSQSLLPRPNDWRHKNIVTGFWRIPVEIHRRLGGLTTRYGLTQWLSQGPSPIYFGLGSMKVRNPKKILNIIHCISKELKQRFIIQMESAVSLNLLPNITESIFPIAYIDHTWLFSQCKAVVHHGGSGTTAVALEAGKPMVVCSIFADQFLWGERVEYLKLGFHLPFAKITKNKLRNRLVQVLTPDYQFRSLDFSRKLSVEDGLSVAVNEICGSL